MRVNGSLTPDDLKLTTLLDSLVLPTYTHNNYRLAALGALGYAGVILAYANEELNPDPPYSAAVFLAYVDGQLTAYSGDHTCFLNTAKSSNSPNSGYFHNFGTGYLEHNSLPADGEDGSPGWLMSEGFSYTSQVLDTMLPYFIARKRLTTGRPVVFLPELRMEHIAQIPTRFYARQHQQTVTLRITCNSG